MAKEKNSPPPDPGPPSNGWVISFSDCMTNLLCFFVLLVSFSSFDPVAQGRIQGAFTSMTASGLSDSKLDPTDSVVPPQQRPFDPTVEGAEKRTDAPPEPIRKTHHDAVPDVKAFHDQVTICIPASKLFWGSGELLTPAGRNNLKFIGSYMRLLPVRAVVRQQGTADDGSGDLGLRRAWAVVACICDDAHVNRDRFCITGDQTDKSFNSPVIEIRLLRKELSR